METPDLERIRFTAQHFNDLQGLRYGVPLGLMTLGWGGGAMPFRVATVLGALLLGFWARRYYRRLGEVEPQRVDYAAEISVFSPAGATPQLEGFRQVPPITRHLLVTMTLAMILFSVFQTFPRS